MSLLKGQSRVISDVFFHLTAAPGPLEVQVKQAAALNSFQNCPIFMYTINFFLRLILLYI